MCSETPPLHAHPVRPALILVTEAELPDGFIPHLLSELKLKSVTFHDRNWHRLCELVSPFRLFGVKTD